MNKTIIDTFSICSNVLCEDYLVTGEITERLSKHGSEYTKKTISCRKCHQNALLITLFQKAG